MKDLKDLLSLKSSLDAAKDKASRLIEDGEWMGSLTSLEIFTQCLSLHNKINKLLEKGICRIKAQNPRGGRF